MPDRPEPVPDSPSDSKAPSSPQPPPSKASPPCDPYGQVRLLQQALTSDKMRVAFFLGAGCPVAIPSPDDSEKPLIPSLCGLTREVTKKVKEHSLPIQKIIDLLKTAINPEPNLEQMLSQIRLLLEVVNEKGLYELTKDELKKLDAAICTATTDTVNVPLPEGNTPYHQLASWIGGIQRKHPVEIFTSNYDLLMEQALEAQRIPYFDGFTGARLPFFDLPSMDKPDSLPPRWARLWKVHGSVNWWRLPSERIERCLDHPDKESAAQQMIYPSHLKYEQSRRMPYFAMQDRLRAFLAGGQAVLVTCGYSFQDEHLNDIIIQGLSGNPTAICFGLMYGKLDKATMGVELAQQQANLKLLANDGAITGTLRRNWSHDATVDDETLHSSVIETPKQKEPKDTPRKLEMTLGDFRTLGAFLAQQLSESATNEDPAHAK